MSDTEIYIKKKTFSGGRDPNPGSQKRFAKTNKPRGSISAWRTGNACARPVDQPSYVRDVEDRA